MNSGSARCILGLMKTINVEMASEPAVSAPPQCYHCGTACTGPLIEEADRSFCCEGCYTVYSLLSENDLQAFYALNDHPGAQAKRGASDTYALLDDPKVAAGFLDFSGEEQARVTFFAPTIHCSSCIWLLEQLHRIQPGILESRVDFPRKEVFLAFNPQVLSLRQVAELIHQLGYPPDLSMGSLKEKKEKPKTNRRLLLQLGIAGFCFGNIMLLSLPEYFSLDFDSAQFGRMFSFLNLALAIPVVGFSAIDYFRSALKGLGQKHINMDVPISIGITVVFLRSVVEILMDTGPGYMDSLAGLVFFLLIGRIFQDKTYSLLSFDRDYTSYFPLSVSRLKGTEVETVAVADLEQGDRIRVRNGELIPADGVLIEGEGAIDYSFVTGESEPEIKRSGAIIYAGGRQKGAAIEVEVTREVERSYLTRLWNHEAFRKKDRSEISRLSDRVSKWFTLIVLAIATVAGIFWLIYDASLALHVTSAVLIIACPCALALATPFSLGHALRVFGRNRLYLKGAEVVESLAEVDTLVFDKTGTLTESGNAKVIWSGTPLTGEEETILSGLFAQSTHPMSQAIHRFLGEVQAPVAQFEEQKGLGWTGTVGEMQVKAGSQLFVQGVDAATDATGSRVYIQLNGQFRGCFQLEHPLREGLTDLTQELAQTYELYLLSGDTDKDADRLTQLLPGIQEMHFQQGPEDKLTFIQGLQERGKKVLMMGDGLNDSGALKQADVGISLTEDISAFTPASDGILGAEAFAKFGDLIQFSKTAMKVIRWSFGLSLIYNVIGMSFAVTGTLSPLVAAILMPASSISVVAFTTLLVNGLAKRKLARL